MSEDIKLKITADSSDAVKDLAKVEKAVDETTKAVKENTKAVKDNKTESKSMIQSLADVKAGYDGIKEVLAKVIQFMGESVKKYKESGANLKELGDVMKQVTKDTNDFQIATGKLLTTLANTVLEKPKDTEKSTLGTISSLLNKISDWVDKNSDTIGTVFKVAALANPVTGLATVSTTVFDTILTKLDEVTEKAKTANKEMTNFYKLGLDPSDPFLNGLVPTTRRKVKDLPALKDKPKAPKSTVKRGLGEAIDISERDVADYDVKSAGGFAFSEEDVENYEAKMKAIEEDKIERQKRLDEMVQKSIDKNEEAARKRKEAHEEEMRQIAEREAALRQSVGMYNTVANAAVSALETAGAGERELAFLQGLIAQANAIGAFFNPALGGPAGAAAFQAQALALFAAAGTSGGGGGGGGGGKSSIADLQSQRIEAQKQNTMALKEAFSEAMKEANSQGRNITYVINQNGNYLGNDNASLIKIKEALDGTQRVQFRS